MATRKKRILTDIKVRNAKPDPEKQVLLQDGDGLYLEINKSGSKIWRMKAMMQGRSMRLTFGSYPAVSLSQARKKCDEARVQIAQGVDPREEKKAAEAAEKARKANTFERLARRLYDSKAGKTTEKYRAAMLRQMEIHLFPVIGDKPMQDISGKEILELLLSVSQKPSKTGQPLTYMAKKLCSWMAEVFDLFNVENGFIIPNPCRQIIKLLPKHIEKNAKQIPQDQIQDFVRALDAYGGHFYTKAAIWMMLYTGFRTISVRRALWQDFDLKKAVWNRPPEKRDLNTHPVPLPKQAVRLLEALQVMTGGKPDGYVFPSGQSYRSDKQMSENAVNQAMERMGFDADGHGIRGTVQTALNERGYDSRMVEVQVGHLLKNPVEAAYNKARYFEARRKMMQAWADELESMLKPEKKVVRFRKQAA